MEFTGPYKAEEVIIIESGVHHVLVSDANGNPLVEAFDMDTAKEVIRRLEEYEKYLLQAMRAEESS